MGKKHTRNEPQAKTSTSADPRRAKRVRGARTSAFADSFALRLGSRMRDLRLEKGLSLASLKRAGGLTPSQMSSAERGRVLITMGTVSSVAQALGMPAFLLLALPGDDALTAVLEEIRQAWAGDPYGAGEELLGRLEEREGGRGPRGGPKRSPAV